MSLKLAPNKVNKMGWMVLGLVYIYIFSDKKFMEIFDNEMFMRYNLEIKILC